MAEVKKKTITKEVKKPVKKAASVSTKKAAEKVVARKADVVKTTVEVAVSTSFDKAQDKKKSMSADVYDLTGKVAGKVTLPAEMFGDKVNKTLVSQAVRVYLANKRQGTVSTKTRGEVDGSTRKIYRQKGTGRARHGSIRAPIFVKGGIVFGPRPRDYSLELPTKMKRKALFSVLSGKLTSGEIKIVSGFEDITPKTKKFVAALQKLELDGKKRSVLLVTAGKTENLKRAAGNVSGVNLLPANLLNAYEVIKNKHLVLMKDAVSEMEKTFLAKK
jgi:large subunit ribosomal protein L4